MINIKKWGVPEDKAIAAKRLEFVKLQIKSLAARWAEVSGSHKREEEWGDGV